MLFSPMPFLLANCLTAIAGAELFRAIIDPLPSGVNVKRADELIQFGVSTRSSLEVSLNIVELQNCCFACVKRVLLFAVLMVRKIRD